MIQLAQFGSFLGSSSSGLRRKLFRYWSYYGGFSAIIRSPYVWIAIFFTISLAPLWLSLEDERRAWVDIPIFVLPSLLGFSIGAFALMVGLGTLQSLELIFEGESSYFIKLSANYIHFIIVQMSAFIFSIFVYNYGSIFILGALLSAIGFFLFIYAFMTLLAISFYIFSVARMINEEMNNRIEEKNSSKEN